MTLALLALVGTCMAVTSLGGPDKVLPWSGQDQQCWQPLYRCGPQCGSYVHFGACYCDSLCLVHHDCCEEFATSCPDDHQQALQLLAKFPDAEIRCGGKGGKMVASCDNATEAALAANCSRGAQMGDPERTPVRSSSLGISFANHYCALCRGVRASDLLSWTTLVEPAERTTPAHVDSASAVREAEMTLASVLPTLDSFGPRTAHDSIQRNQSDPSDLSTVNGPEVYADLSTPVDLVSSHTSSFLGSGAHDSDLATGPSAHWYAGPGMSRGCISAAVSACPDLPDPSPVSLDCRGGHTAYTKSQTSDTVYRNRHCALCHGETLCTGVIPKDFYTASDGGTEFSFLMKWRQSSQAGTRTVLLTSSSGKNGWVSMICTLDPRGVSCQPEVCAYNHQLSQGACVLQPTRLEIVVSVSLPPQEEPGSAAGSAASSGGPRSRRDVMARLQSLPQALGSTLTTPGWIPFTLGSMTRPGGKTPAQSQTSVIDDGEARVVESSRGGLQERPTSHSRVTMRLAQGSQEGGRLVESARPDSQGNPDQATQVRALLRGALGALIRAFSEAYPDGQVDGKAVTADGGDGGTARVQASSAMLTRESGDQRRQAAERVFQEAQTRTLTCTPPSLLQHRLHRLPQVCFFWTDMATSYTILHMCFDYSEIALDPNFDSVVQDADPGETTADCELFRDSNDTSLPDVSEAGCGGWCLVGGWLPLLLLPAPLLLPLHLHPYL